METPRSRLSGLYFHLQDQYPVRHRPNHIHHQLPELRQERFLHRPRSVLVLRRDTSVLPVVCRVQETEHPLAVGTMRGIPGRLLLFPVFWRQVQY